MFQINPIGLLALLALVLCWSLAVVLYRVGVPGSVARRLALLLLVEGITMFSTGYFDLFLTEAVHQHPNFPTWVKIEEIVHTLGDCAMLALYPPFLAIALQTPLTRPFGTRSARWVLAGLSALLCLSVFLTPLRFGATLLYVLLVAVFVFALVASVNAWYRAVGQARARAAAFAVAFGIRDALWGVVYSYATLSIWSDSYLIADPNAAGLIYVVYALGTLLAVPLIAYGILRTHLFDIDLRIRWTIRQSTLAAVFVAVFYVISEGAERLLSAELGGWAGLMAAGVVIAFLTPLQKFAERVASTAMPNTRNTPEYIAHCKMQVYEAALGEALRGGISEKERALINHLRESLGISPADAEALEHDVRAQAMASP